MSNNSNSGATGSGKSMSATEALLKVLESNSRQSEARVRQIEENVQNCAKNAQKSENNAKQSADDAKESETNAKKCELNIQEIESRTKNILDDAKELEKKFWLIPQLRWSLIQTILWIVLFGIFAVLLINNTRPHEENTIQAIHEYTKAILENSSKTLKYKVTTTSTRKRPIPSFPCMRGATLTLQDNAEINQTVEGIKFYTITQDEMESALKAAAYAASLEAEKEYKNNFSILIAILAVFGIAWPVVVGFLNFKFNENTLDKITTTERKANAASDTANVASNKANVACSTAESVNEKTKDLKQKVDKASSGVFYIAGEMRAERGDNCEGNKTFYLYLLSINNYAASSVFDDKNKYLCENVCKKIANILKKIEKKFTGNISSTEKKSFIGQCTMAIEAIEDMPNDWENCKKQKDYFLTKLKKIKEKIENTPEGKDGDGVVDAEVVE